jgi:hypothetical protein
MTAERLKFKKQYVGEDLPSTEFFLVLFQEHLPCHNERIEREAVVRLFVHLWTDIRAHNTSVQSKWQKR